MGEEGMVVEEAAATPPAVAGIAAAAAEAPMGTCAPMAAVNQARGLFQVAPREKVPVGKLASIILMKAATNSATAWTDGTTRIAATATGIGATTIEIGIVIEVSAAMAIGDTKAIGAVIATVTGPTDMGSGRMAAMATDTVGMEDMVDMDRATMTMITRIRPGMLPGTLAAKHFSGSISICVIRTKRSSSMCTRIVPPTKQACAPEIGLFASIENPSIPGAT